MSGTQPLTPPPPRSTGALDPTALAGSGLPPGVQQAVGAIEFSQVWSGWFRKFWLTLNSLLSQGYTGQVKLASLTSGGSQGSLTVTNGVITGYTAPS